METGKKEDFAGDRKQVSMVENCGMETEHVYRSGMKSRMMPDTIPLIIAKEMESGNDRTVRSYEKFDTFTAVDHLNLRIETGEFFGLLGPNGAGKTTTISLMSTLLLPTGGRDPGGRGSAFTEKSRLKRKISVITRSIPCVRHDDG